ncbi:galactosylceramide sulfotransferase-like isoform X2 [Glandiceps talaboti]
MSAAASGRCIRQKWSSLVLLSSVLIALSVGLIINKLSTDYILLPAPLRTNENNTIRWQPITKSPRHTVNYLICHPINNFVFVKTHKTGSTTLSTILDRYGYNRNLSFMFNRKDHLRVGHIRRIAINRDSPKKLFAPPINVDINDTSRFIFNISTVHLTFNKTALDLFMTPNTKYITILRDPATQFESYFWKFGLNKHVCRLKNKLNSTLNDECFLKFARDPGRYKSVMSGTNTQFQDLGLPRSKLTNETFINETIQKLQNELDFVLITEYFDESLLLMRKLFCWNMTDIIYLAQNVRQIQPSKYSTDVYDKIRLLNRADFLLYLNFNKTLWKRVAEYGPTFQSDLSEFRSELRNFSDNCIISTNASDQAGRQLNIPQSSPSKECKQAILVTKEWMKLITKRQH